MQQILAELNQEVGVKGSALLLRDGVLVLSDIKPPLKADVVAAVASTAIKEINLALTRVHGSPFNKFVLNAEYGKMVFCDTGEAYLVVVLEKHINTDLAMLSIQSSARRVRASGGM